MPPKKRASLSAAGHVGVTPAGRESRWGAARETVSRTVRGSIGDVLVVLRATSSQLTGKEVWSFECHGRAGLSARSTGIYHYEGDARQAAELMADALMALAKLVPLTRTL